MTTLPTTLAMIAASLTVTSLLADHNADFNNDGFVNANDLVLLTSNLNIACDGECPTDLNHDGMTDVTDILLLLGQWGAVEGYVAEETEEDTPLPVRDPNRDMSWQGQGPVLLDAIYYDLLCRGGERLDLAEELNQGEHTKAWAAENGIAVQPISYNGAVDWYEDGEYSDDDKERFKNWLDSQVPADYDGPICLDMEGTWWNMLNTSNQTVMDNVVAFYVEGLEYAKSLRPNAKIGYWGLPKKQYTSQDPTERASIERLLLASTGIFPDVYEYQPNSDDASRLQSHVEACIELVNGEIPVYVQAFPRYKSGPGTPLEFHTQEEFLHDQVQAALDAVWTDANGMEHRINGVALWDAYLYAASQTDGWSEMNSTERKAVWNVLDEIHVDFLSAMKFVVDIAAEAASQRREIAQKQPGETKAATKQVETNAVTQEAETNVAIQQESETNAAIQQEAETNAATQEVAERQEQRSQLVERLSSANALLLASTSTYTSKARSYRKSRKSLSNSKRALTKAKRKYSKGSKQYQHALATMKKASKNARSVSRTYRTKRNQYLAARAAVNTAQVDWDQAETEWSQEG